MTDIDRERVTHTRGGLDVYDVRLYQDDRGEDILVADVDNGDGGVDFLTYNMNGRYWSEIESNWDLVEDPLPVIDVVVVGELGDDPLNPVSSPSEPLRECIVSIYAALGVYLQETEGEG